EPRRASLRKATNVTVESVRGVPKLDSPTLSSLSSLARPAEDKLARVLEIVRLLATEDGTLEVHAARDRKGDEPHAAFSRSVAESVVRTGEPVVAMRARED